MKMYDASESESERYGEEMPMESVKGSSKKETRKYYPHLDLNSNQFPEIGNMKVGSKVMLMVEVKPTRFSINEKEGKEPKSEMCFEITRVGMAEDQDAGKEGSEKVDKMVEKMYPKKEEK
jgi:hypothetical protein